MPEGAGQLRDGGDGGETVRRVRGDVSGGRKRNDSSADATRTTNHLCIQGTRCPLLFSPKPLRLLQA